MVGSTGLGTQGQLSQPAWRESHLQARPGPCCSLSGDPAPVGT